MTKSNKFELRVAFRSLAIITALALWTLWVTAESGVLAAAGDVGSWAEICKKATLDRSKTKIPPSARCPLCVICRFEVPAHPGSHPADCLPSRRQPRIVGASTHADVDTPTRRTVILQQPRAPPERSRFSTRAE
jgi:hypothetical protein